MSVNHCMSVNHEVWIGLSCVCTGVVCFGIISSAGVELFSCSCSWNTFSKCIINIIIISITSAIIHIIRL